MSKFTYITLSKIKKLGESTELPIFILAATNPISLDFFLPLSSVFGNIWYKFDSSDAIGFYVAGLAAGQLLAAPALALLGLWLSAALAGIFFSMSTLSLLYQEQYELALIARAFTGVASGYFYYICLQIIIYESSDIIRANNYSARTNSVLYSAFFLPLLSAALVNFGLWQAILFIQALYGVLCIFIVKLSKMEISFLTSRRHGTRSISEIWQGTFVLLIISITLYTTLSMIPKIFVSDMKYSSVKIALTLLFCAVSYNIGVIFRKKYRHNSSFFLLYIASPILTIFLLLSYIKQVTILSIFIIFMTYFICGAAQGLIAAHVYSAKIFNGLYTSSIFSFLLLTLSSLSIFIYKIYSESIFFSVFLVVSIWIITSKYKILNNVSALRLSKIDA